MSANLADLKGLTFSCRPGCGFCCTASPLVQPTEAPRLPTVVRGEDGTLRIPLAGPRCSMLQPDATCGVYEARPAVCRLYPFQVHAGRRLQAVASLACPGIAPGEPGAMSAEDGARDAVAIALAQPGAAGMAQRAKDTFIEFDRRMKEWGVAASPDRLRAGFLPHAAHLAHPAALPSLFGALESGDLVLDGNAARAVEALFETETDVTPHDLLAQAARDAFDDPGTALWVEPDLTWSSASMDDALTLRRWREGAWRAKELDVEALPIDWDADATAHLAGYLTRLMHRDHTEGAAAWLVDASGYQATLPAAYARVLGEASLQVLLRASMLAADEGLEVVDLAMARRGVTAYETSYHSLPTLGAIL